jgi:hypothetical protein
MTPVSQNPALQWLSKTRQLASMEENQSGLKRPCVPGIKNADPSDLKITAPQMNNEYRIHPVLS